MQQWRWFNFSNFDLTLALSLALSHFARFDLIQQLTVGQLQPLRVKGVQLYICTLGPSLTSLEL